MPSCTLIDAFIYCCCLLVRTYWKHTKKRTVCIKSAKRGKIGSNEIKSNKQNNEQKTKSKACLPTKLTLVLNVRHVNWSSKYNSDHPSLGQMISSEYWAFLEIHLNVVALFYRVLKSWVLIETHLRLMCFWKRSYQINWCVIILEKTWKNMLWAIKQTTKRQKNH